MVSLLDLLDVGYNSEDGFEGMVIAFSDSGFYMNVPHELVLKYLQIFKEVKGHEKTDA